MVEVETPVKFGGVTEAPRKASPFLGQHTSELLSEIGYSKDAIETMKEQGIVIEKDGPSDLGQG